MRRATVQEFVARRFAALEAQGHGPQRHEGAVTRQMLEDRVLRGIDPMTGTRTDGVSGRRHVRSWAATRITTPEAFVAAEAFIRRTPDYRTARDAALFDPAYWRGRFEVILPIEDVLGPDFRSLVEGVRRNTGPADLSGLSEVVFDEGLMVARFALDSMGEPRLITMFPVGR